MAHPKSVHLWSYRVGFGDCFLLRFVYPRFQRHVLIDFGSTAPPTKAETSMVDIAQHIAETCGGKLDVIIATHRHKDHISGFAGNTWKILQRLSPVLVVLPWTEHPAAETDAKVAPSGSLDGIGEHSSRFVRSLSSMHEVAQAVIDELNVLSHQNSMNSDWESENSEPDDDALSSPTPEEYATRNLRLPAVRQQLAFLGEDNLRNAQAVKNLLSRPCEFMAFGSTSKHLSTLLPGVTIHVLGPPTLAQTETITRQRSCDPDEFWHLALGAAKRSASPKQTLFPHVEPVPIQEHRVETNWFIKRLDAARGQQLLELVRILDSAMNNTSLILLFETCGKKILFPGDAQIENWAYALSHPKVRKLLAGVDVYKVGHHGSLNATPKTLWAGFTKKGKAGARGRLKTFMSTRSGKHGCKDRGTEVPRRKLVKELRTFSELFSTQELTGKSFFKACQLAP